MSRTTIHWEEIHRRLQTSEETLRRVLSEDAATIKSVYRERAVQLARPPKQKVADGTAALIFLIGGEHYALPLQELAEVLPFHGCTPVPGSSPLILGVIDLRGEIRPLINLARVLSAAASTDSGAVLVLRRPIALKVDGIEDLREIRREEVAPAAPGKFAQVLTSGTLAVLDLEAVLSAVLPRKESRTR